MDFSTLLHRYAILLVRHGLNVQPGQIVNLSGEVYHRELLYLLAEEAYRQGASYVTIDLIEARLQRLRISSSTEEQMLYVPRYIESKYRELLDSKAANLRLVGMEDPEVLSNLDVRKVNIGRKANYGSIRCFYEEGIGRSQVHWCVAAAATPRWAQRLFPRLSSEEALASLWNTLFKISRVLHDDYLEQWTRHNACLHQRALTLTNLGIEELLFRGPGTDLVVGLSTRARFRAGSDLGPYGASFQPNIPTEECFSTPDCRRTHGIVRTTRPFLVNGEMVRGLELEFRGGEIVNANATSGIETFREYISSDAGARKLGEVALVGIDSAVYQSGLVFEEILLDENAACHIAIGSAYKFCLFGHETLSAADLLECGCNESSVHTDMMISSEQVDVIASLRTGAEQRIIEKGRWVI